MPLHGVESGKQTHFVRGIAALFYEGRWRLTTVGRGRPPALIRLARRSPNPKSDQRASVPSLANGRRDIEGIAKTNPLQCRYTELKAENKPTLSAELLHFFMKAGGASPPSGVDALRLSSGWHAGRQIRRATSTPATFSREREKGHRRECESKPT